MAVKLTRPDGYVVIKMSDELWIDLHSLISSASFENDLVCFYYGPGEDKETLTYLLRKALREVGFKIVSWKTCFDKNFEPELVEYFTDIPKALWDSKTVLWSDWTTEVCEDFHDISDSESESEDEIMPPA